MGFENIVILVIAVGFLAVVGVLTFKIVPQNEAFVIERLGKYNKTLEAGLHILIPFVDRVAYKHSLKEMVVNVPQQEAITKDNISVGIDGILYIKVTDAKKASYGIDDYFLAAAQLSQTTVRSEIGKMELEATFEERDKLNLAVVSEVDKAAQTWGVKVMRFEIKDINPPASIKDAMEKKMKAEREKRAIIETSEGQKQAAINKAEGEKEAAIAASEGEKQKRINEAEGEKKAVIAAAEAEAEKISKVATASAEAINKIAAALKSEGGHDAMNMKLAQEYIGAFSNIAKEGNTILLPADTGNAGGMVASIMQIAETIKHKSA